MGEPTDLWGPVCRVWEAAVPEALRRVEELAHSADPKTARSAQRLLKRYRGKLEALGLVPPAVDPERLRALEDALGGREGRGRRLLTDVDVRWGGGGRTANYSTQ